MASTKTRWPGLDEESLDPRVLDELDPADPPEEEEEEDGEDDSESASMDFGVAEDEDE